MSNLTRLREKMTTAGLNSLVVSNIENIQWLTGFTGTNGLALITPQDGCFLTDSRYTIQASKEVKDLESFSFANPKTMPEFLAEHVNRIGLKKLGFERNLSYDTWESWGKHLSTTELIPSPDLITDLRLIKTSSEIESIRNACKLADACMEHVQRMIQPGVSEFDIGLDIEFFFRRQGAEIAFPPIVASGLNSAKPHGRATEKRLEHGDFITLDFGAKVDGYASDITRTFVVGKANDRQRQIYSAVLEAQEAAILAIKPGVNGRDVDRLAREILAKYGLADYFGHGLGHGLGRSVHDGGRLSPTTDQWIEPGQIWTIEPGVYISDFGGVRIEDDVRVTSDGVEVLTHFPKKLMELPV